MKKKIILRGLLGIPLGVAIGFVIAIFVSLAVGDGGFHPVAEPLIYEFGSELNAVIFQTVLSGVLGAAFAISSLIWEIESWGIAKQTGVYFLAISAALFPVAYFAHWLERTAVGFAIYFGIFVAIFIVIWVVQYFIVRSKIGAINRAVNKE